LFQVRTRLSIGYSKSRGRFKGKASANTHNCQTFRNVTVKRKKKGRDPVIGTTTTNSHGKYKVNFRNAHGRFYANVAAKTYFNGNGDEFDCNPDRSPTIRV
jgi:hypothetical protein